MCKKLSKLLSMTLVLALVIQMLPASAFAANDEDKSATTSNAVSEVVTEEVEIVEEVIDKRSEFSKEYKLSNGLHMSTVYADPVHYEEDGQWKDIDNTLKSSGLGVGAVLTNTAGVWDVSFPQQLSANKAVSITKDGYTLSFFMSGELRTSGDLAVASINASAAEQFSVQSSRTASAQIQTIDLSEKKAQARFPETVSDKLHSRVKYENVYSGTNIIYDLTSNQVKESIVMESYDSTRRGYRYTLNTGSMIPVLSDSGEINLYDETKTTVVMTMPAPFLLDNAGEYNDDITVTLTGSNGTYTLTYLLPQDWLSDSQRQWPVILDPMVSANIDRTNIWDIGVYEQNGYLYDLNSGVMDVGRWTKHGVMRTYIQYRVLPELSSADVIVAAELEMYKVTQNNNPHTTEVHKVLETWPEVIDWSTQPEFDETVEDFVVGIDAGYYYWDVTDIARGWYEGENTGLMLKIPTAEETATSYVPFRQQYYSSDFGLLYKPTVTLYFRNNNGLESYWDYTASSAGRAGTGYINDYTGNLVWIRGDIGFGGNRMPVSINHIYNANDNQNNMFGMGYGWRTNFNQRVYQWTTNTNYYVWEDSDGTDHYFYYDSTVGKYVDEDGLELTLTTTGSGTEKFCITDKYGNKSFFDTYGRLTKQQNNQATPSSIVITYTTTSGYLISTITDGAGRVYTFSYNSSNLLSRIAYKGTGSTELSYLTFGYSGSLLTTITDKDGEVSTYGYGTNNLLTSAQDVDGYKLAYTYTTTTAGKPSRVATVTESDGSVTGGKLTIAYAHNQTTFTDIKGNVQIKQFNNWGNTVSIQDDQGRAQYAQYANNGEVGSESTEKGNQLTVSSKLQNTVGNMINDSSFESGTTWTNLSSAVSHSVVSDVAYWGNKCLVMTRSAAGTASGVYKSFSVPANSSITLSAYVKTTSGTTAYLALTDGTTTKTSETMPAGTNWKRMQVIFHNDTSTAKTVTARLMTETAGTIYMDNVQVELAATASRYNLVENGDFRYTTNWTRNSNCTSTDLRTTTSTAAPATQLDSNVYSLTGSYTTEKSVSQTINSGGGIGDTFVFAGWGKGDSVAPSSRDTNKPLFAIRATFNNADGTTTPFTAEFNPDAGDVWQYTAGVMVSDKWYSSITVEFVYAYNANTALFDGIQLFHEQFGSSYTYDDNGNVTSVKDLQGQTTTYEYTSNNLTKEILPTGAALTYTYDNYHNVKTATTATGVVYNFAYDTYGNNTSVSILNGSTAMTSTAAYTTDGNRLSTTTDAAGKVTTYDYDANTNVLKSVQYPKDTSTTKTTYSYDSMYRLASAAATSDYGSALTVDYTYTDDLLTEIETGSTTYSFSYGDFARRSSIQIGSRTLATYTYETTTGRLTQLDYGNGDVVKYIYDKQGNVTKQTYEDGDTVTYKYDNDGALATVTDSATGISTTYYYDFTDRLMKYVEQGTGHNYSVEYGYNNVNNLTSMAETINGTKQTTSYTYDNDNRPVTITVGNTTETYAYDTYGRVNQRVTKNGDTTVKTETITYRNPTTSTTTGQIATQTSSVNGSTITRSYTYDANGNITSVSDGTYTTTYVYDTLNQLVRENNRALNKTWTWEYDDAGNILNRNEYAYTTGTLGTATDTVAYTYGDSAWGDLLTAYDGKTITYDAIGNPISDSEWTYTWEHGRQLASMSNGTTTWTFTYDASGRRIGRTDGTTTYSYVYRGDLLVQMKMNSDVFEFAYDADGRPLSVTWNGNLYYYVTNQQGDVIKILDDLGTDVAMYDYSSWGEWISAGCDHIEFYNPLCYRGYVYDHETGLYYVSSRYYDPEIGRWINADSLLNQESVLGNNMFAYCLNNPVNMADTTGELPFFLVTAAIGAVAGAIIGGVVAAKNGGNVWAGIGIGAAAGGLAGAGLGAAAGVMLAGSATASTTAIASCAGMLATAVSTGGAGAGLALVADNISRAVNNVGTVLYSGGEQARQAATTFANNTGGTTIDPTVIGQVADAATKVPGADFTTVWSQASAAFCHQASGVVNAFVSNSAYRGVDSIFWSVEMPTLLNNPRVTEIIIHIFE